MAVSLDYKPTRYEGKGFLRNLNIRRHKYITGEMWFGVITAKRELLYHPELFFILLAFSEDEDIYLLLVP